MTSSLDKAIEQFNPSNRAGFESLKLDENDDDLDLSAMDHPDTMDDDEDEMIRMSRLDDGDRDGESIVREVAVDTPHNVVVIALKRNESSLSWTSRASSPQTCFRR